MSNTFKVAACDVAPVIEGGVAAAAVPFGWAAGVADVIDQA
jgi:hypothetical protein